MSEGIPVERVVRHHEFLISSAQNLGAPTEKRWNSMVIACEYCRAMDEALLALCRSLAGER